jgi:hypothetical protein
MKRIIITALFVAATLSVSLYAQTATVVVHSDLDNGTEGNLNTAINNVITADPTGNQLSNTVFQLEPYGYYILTSTITTPRHAHLYLVGPNPGTTQATALPQIAWTNSGGVTTTFNFDCYGDVTMKNIWILCARTSGAQVGSSIVIEDDSLANLSGKGEHLDMDGCIIDYMSIGNGGGAIEPACQHFRGKITNTYFRNMTDPHYRYYGRPVSWTYQSTTWHTDTLMFENCTIANAGYGYMQEAPEYADYVSFNHCTFAQTMMFTLESNYWFWLSITNCLFVNAYMYGDIPSGDGANAFGNGGMANVDSVRNFGFTVPFTDDQRHILLTNNSYGHEKWYIDYLNNNPYTPANEADRIHRMPAMNRKTWSFFVGIDSTTGKKKFPYMNVANLYPPVDTMGDLPTTYKAAVDPGFILNPVNIDSIKAFLLGRWQTGANVNWAYDPASDIAQLWPLNEDLSYTNSTLKTAAMGRFPLGDLYHWWPAQYTAWSAQAKAERDTINKWLTNGLSGVVAVKELPGIPHQYELAQNYPNPFNPTTLINYSIPQKGYVSLKVYNLLGREVATLIAGVQEAGNYSAPFDGTGLASGVYFYRLQAGSVSITKKLVFMK